MENFFRIFRSNNRPAPSNPTPNPPSTNWQSDLLQHVGGMISVLEKAFDLLSKPSQPAADFEPEESFLSFLSHRRRSNLESWTPNTVETDGLISSIKLEPFLNEEAALSLPNNTSINDTLHQNEERAKDDMETVKEIQERVKQEERLKEFKPIKVPAPESEEQKFEDLMSMPLMPDGLEQQLGMYLAIWESLCSAKGGKKKPLTCNTWLLTVDQVRDDVILKDLQESIEAKLNKISSTKVTTRGMEIEFLTKQEVDVDVNNKDGGFSGRNVVFWAVEERDESKKTRKWDVYLMFKTQVLNGYNSTKEMRDTLRVFRKKRSKDVKCVYQTSFVERLQSIFKGYPGQQRYVTNDTTFKDEFVTLLADAYWKNIVSDKKMQPKVKKSDPIAEYTNELEKLIQEDADKRDWGNFEIKVLKDPMLCHLFGTLISKREYFKSKYDEKRKVLKVNPVKKQQGVVIVIEDEEDVKKVGDVKIKNEEIKKPDTSDDVDMFFAKFEK